MSQRIKDLDPAAAILTSWVEVQEDSGGLGSTKRNQLSDILALAGAGDLDAVLVAGNDAAGIGITELANIDNLTNDFDLLVSHGNVIFNFGNAPSGVFGLDAFADQMQFTADQWVVASSDANMYITVDIDAGSIELANQSNYLRVTEFDIEVGTEILGYLTSSETIAQIQINANSAKFKHDKCIIRTTTALPANTVGGSNTTLTANSNGAFPTIDGVTIATQGQDILVCNEATQTKNGPYTLTQVGSAGTPWILTRRVDSNIGGELECAVYSIEQGTRFKGTSWKQITPSPVLGSSNIIFMPFGDNIVDDGSGGYWKINASVLGVLTTTAV